MGLLPERWRPYGAVTAVVIPLFCLLLWLPLRGQLPVSATITAAPLPGLIWQVDALSWPVTAWLLLLLMAVFAQHALTPSPAYSLILTAFTFPLLWAGSPHTLLVGWMALLVVWGTAVWLAERGPAAERRFFWHMGLLLTAGLLLWLGAAALPAGTVAWDVAAWPQTALLAVLLAALLQTGIWPFSSWRAGASVPPGTALVLGLWPVAAGGLLLVRLADGAILTLLGGGVLLTLAGLFGLLWGVRLLWERLHLPGTAVFFLTMAITHLLLLTAVWGSQVAAAPGGVLAWLRVLLLAGGICFLAATRPVTRTTWWRAAPPLVALAAVVGLLLTAGLAGHVALYEGLVSHGRYLALVVTVLLQIPLLTAGLRLFWPQNLTQRDQSVAETQREEAKEEFVLSPARMMTELAVFLPALGLVSVSGVDWGAVSWFTWLLLLIVPVGGVVLLRFVPEFHRTVAAVRTAFTLRLPVNAAPLRQWLHGMGGALAEAAAILEGDGSLVWLLVLIVVLLLAW